MTTQSLPKHTHHASPTHEPPAATARDRDRRDADSGDRDHRDRLRPACGALEAARRADRRGRTAGRRAGASRRHPRAATRPARSTITYYPGEAALRDAIRNRDVYGGISFGPDGPHTADRHRRQPDGRPAAEPGRQRHRPALRRAAAHRGPGTADRRRPARRRAWRRPHCRSRWPACCPRSRWCLLLQARGVDPFRRRRGVRWAGRLDDRRVCCATSSARSTRTSGALLAGLTLGATRRRAVDAGPGLAVRPRRPCASARCWRCCWATRCRA